MNQKKGDMKAKQPDAAFRLESDSMGDVRVPVDAHYGPQTQRAVNNFFNSGLKPPIPLVHALAMIKLHAARTNAELGLLDLELANPIAAAAQEIMEGRWIDQFVVDLFQTGSGTSTNMNMNEVIASRANEILTSRKGGRSPVHPNDHVNMGQSSNDVIPTALHVATILSLVHQLHPAMGILYGRLKDKAVQWEGGAQNRADSFAGCCSHDSGTVVFGLRPPD
jgi:fumarate hydratase class II